MTCSGFEERRRVREERRRRAVEAVVAYAHENGLRVEEPTVLNDLFSLMVHLKPAPVVARVATCMPKLRTPIEGWLDREIAVTTYLAEQGAPVVGPAGSCRPAPTSAVVSLSVSGRTSSPTRTEPRLPTTAPLCS
jgi:hypothetical protein